MTPPELWKPPPRQYFVCAAVGHGDLLFGGMTSDNKLEILHKVPDSSKKPTPEIPYWPKIEYVFLNAENASQTLYPLPRHHCVEPQVKKSLRPCLLCTRGGPTEP